MLSCPPAASSLSEAVVPQKLKQPSLTLHHHHYHHHFDHNNPQVSLVNSFEQTQEEQEEKEEKTGSNFPDEFEFDSSIIERFPPPPDHQPALSTKIRRKFSSTILRNNEHQESLGTTTRPPSADTGLTIEALPRGRRRGLSITASLQRLFYPDVGDPTPATTTRSDPLPLWRASAECLYGFMRRGQQPSQIPSEWDFICQGEAPVVPPRSDHDDQHKLLYSSITSWTSDDYSFEFGSPASSPTTSINTFSTSALPPSPLESSSTPPLARQSYRPLKVLIQDISPPIPSLSHRPACPPTQPFPPSTSLPSNPSLTSFIEISDL